MFSIGEFSRATGLTVKALRFYHEQGILNPTYVEPGSGYRFYGESKLESARVIATLRELGFSIAEVSEILHEYAEDADIVAYLESRKEVLQERMRQDRRTVKQLNVILDNARDAGKEMTHSSTQVERKIVEPILIARIRMTGRYSECGPLFGKIGRKFGRYVTGRAMMLCHDGEYRENDATFDAAMPVKSGETDGEVVVEELSGGHCISLMHFGPYEELGRTYERLLKYAGDNGLRYRLPTREIYHKGPGMIFRGNPKKYVTEVQFLVVDDEKRSPAPVQ